MHTMRQRKLAAPHDPAPIINSAVGVVDLLPGYLSSVYFFFDPQYTCLNLGTYSALRETAFVRHHHRTFGAMVPAYADFTYYSMGHHAHSCTKVNYKAEYSLFWLARPKICR
ncbi:Arginyl-tRNA--protein transferase 1 [Echinococcus granulosus]|nr:Arginyl-tRNA--protein transferase 1 [Echinococcus granulosus]